MLGFLSSLALVFVVSHASAYDAPAERAKMMAALAAVPLQPSQVFNLDKASAENAALAKYFTEEIWPQMAKVKKLASQADILHVAGDRALYNTDEEKAEWNNRESELRNEINALESSKAWRDKVAQFEKLSVAAKTGELAVYGQRAGKLLQLAQFDESTLPLQKRLSVLEVEVKQILNDSPIAKKLTEFEQKRMAIMTQYFSKKLSFQEATDELEALRPISRPALGADVAARGQEFMHEMAVIRTRLAQSKGYKNWAEYKVASQSLEHADPFNKVEDRLKFLRDLQSQSLPAYKKFLGKRVAAIRGASLDKMRRVQYPLIGLPEAVLLKPYLPLDNALPNWKSVMEKSGFAADELSNISWDIYPRPSKHSHAYMNNVTALQPKVLSVDAATLNIVKPAGESELDAANIQIVQNMREDGPEGYRTTLHEGGHAIEHVFQWNPFLVEPSYGWSETPSNLMEHFGVEPGFLRFASQSQPRKLSDEIIKAYLTNRGVNYILLFRRQVAQAEADIEIWNHAYTEDGEDYTTRAKAVMEKAYLDATLMPTTDDSSDNASSAFSTTHYTFGSVRYIGYIQAFVGSELSYQALLDKLQAKTGRRELMNQPEIAPILKAYFSGGASRPFPLQIEAFTGKKFSAGDFVKGLVDGADSYAPSDYDFIPSGADF